MFKRLSRGYGITNAARQPYLQVGGRPHGTPGTATQAAPGDFLSTPKERASPLSNDTPLGWLICRAPHEEIIPPFHMKRSRGSEKLSDLRNRQWGGTEGTTPQCPLAPCWAHTLSLIYMSSYFKMRKMGLGSTLDLQNGIPKGRPKKTSIKPQLCSQKAEAPAKTTHSGPQPSNRGFLQKPLLGGSFPANSDSRARAASVCADRCERQSWGRK